MQMPWGKFRGQDLAQIPLDYIVWALEHAASVEPRLRTALVDEVGKRLGLVRPSPPRTERPTNEGTVAAVFDRWFRAAVMRFHPDRGGDPQLMAALNNLRDEFRDVVGGGRA